MGGAGKVLATLAVGGRGVDAGLSTVVSLFVHQDGGGGAGPVGGAVRELRGGVEEWKRERGGVRAASWRGGSNGGRS